MIRLLLRLAPVLCLLLARPVLAAPVSVSISVTPPAPVPFTAAVNQTATLAGVSYTVTGTLTFTPPGGTAAAAPQAGGNPVPGPLAALPAGRAAPLIAGYKNAAGQWAESFAPGDTAYVEGRAWGSEPGTARLAGLPATVTEWLDEEIGLAVPAAAVPARLPVEVRRPDGAYVLTLGLLVRPS